MVIIVINMQEQKNTENREKIGWDIIKYFKLLC